MRGAKVVFCRERNKSVKITNLGGFNISVFYTENEEWNNLNSSKSKKILKLFKLPVILSSMP